MLDSETAGVSKCDDLVIEVSLWSRPTRPSRQGMCPSNPREPDRNRTEADPPRAYPPNATQYIPPANVNTVNTGKPRQKTTSSTFPSRARKVSKISTLSTKKHCARTLRLECCGRKEGSFLVCKRDIERSKLDSHAELSRHLAKIATLRAGEMGRDPGLLSLEVV